MLLVRCNKSYVKLWIGKNPERITKIKPFINKYNWEGINFLAEKDDWKKIEKNNVRIALNVLYAKKEKIYSAYVLKNTSTCEKQIILLMISNGEKWHYLAVKKLSALLRGITSWRAVLLFELSSFLQNKKKNFTRVKKYVKIKIFVM